jgi:hypothetical protein
MGDLRALAETYVALSGQIEDVRRAMLACLTNGAEPNPMRPARASGGSRPAGKAAEEAETAIKKLVENQPGMGSSAIAKAMEASIATTTDRLRRLRLRGEIAGGGVEGYRVSS